MRHFCFLKDDSDNILVASSSTDDRPSLTFGVGVEISGSAEDPDVMMIVLPRGY